MSDPGRASVVGAGAWGTALALVLVEQRVLRGAQPLRERGERGDEREREEEEERRRRRAREEAPTIRLFPWEQPHPLEEE